MGIEQSEVTESCVKAREDVSKVTVDTPHKLMQKVAIVAR